MASDSKICLKRPHYATVTVHRAAFDAACEAQLAAKGKHPNMVDFASTALGRLATPILKRRDRRLVRLASRASRSPVNHNVTTSSTGNT
jgi:hypothetical protein